MGFVIKTQGFVWGTRCQHGACGGNLIIEYSFEFGRGWLAGVLCAVESLILK